MGLLDFMHKRTSEMDKQVKDSVPAEEVIPQTNTTEPPTGFDFSKLPKDWIRLANHHSQRTHEEKVKALKAKKARKAQKAARKRNRR